MIFDPEIFTNRRPYSRTMSRGVAPVARRQNAMEGAAAVMELRRQSFMLTPLIAGICAI
jgi:hypothetical protein